jgi:hypothetical protein
MPTSEVRLADAIVTAIEPPETSALVVWDSVCAGTWVSAGDGGCGGLRLHDLVRG